MFNLVTMLISTTNTEPNHSTDYKIAHFILDNIETIQKYTITDLAKQCYVSPASISRFCRNIGFSDFTDLRSQLYQLPTNRHEKFIFETSNPTNLLDSYIRSVVTNLEQVKNSLDMSLISKLVKDIYSHSRIGAFGSQQSQHVVLNLQSDLYSSGKLIDTHLKFNHQIDYLNETSSDDLIIIFSHKGKYIRRAMAHGLNWKVEKKPTIYLVSCHSEVEDHRFADTIITINSTDDYSSHPYTFEVVRAVICMEYAKYVKQKSTR